MGFQHARKIQVRFFCNAVNLSAIVPAGAEFQGLVSNTTTSNINGHLYISYQNTNSGLLDCNIQEEGNIYTNHCSVFNDPNKNIISPIALGLTQDHSNLYMTQSWSPLTYCPLNADGSIAGGCHQTDITEVGPYMAFGPNYIYLGHEDMAHLTMCRLDQNGHTGSGSCWATGPIVTDVRGIALYQQYAYIATESDANGYCGIYSCPVYSDGSISGLEGCKETVLPAEYDIQGFGIVGNMLYATVDYYNNNKILTYPINADGSLDSVLVTDMDQPLTGFVSSVE